MANFEQDNLSVVEWLQNNPRKAALIGGGVLLIVVIVGVSVWWFLSTGEDTAQPTVQINSQQEMEQAVDECVNSPNPEACRTQNLTDLARRSNALEPCMELSGTARVDCVWGVARNAMNLTYCDRIEDQSLQTECRDEVMLLQAAQEQDPAICEDISNPTDRNACVARASGPVTSENCSDRGFDETYCADVSLKEEAEQTRDFSLCEQINDKELREGCVQLLARSDHDEDGLIGAKEREFGSSDASVDTDDDGLTDRVEIEVYGTDPADPDTDGDGFNDGDEVDSGYDPAGPGQL
jgi:hypothetical protein